MSTGTGERALLILATMFVAVILYQTAHLGPVARLVPLTIAVPTLMLLVLQLLRDLSPALGRLADQRGLRPVLTRPRARLTQRPSADLTGEAGSGSPRQILAWMAILVALVYLVGLIVASPIFLMSYLRWVARTRWSRAVIVAVVVGLVPYVLSPMVPILSLQDGLLWRWIEGR